MRVVQVGQMWWLNTHFKTFLPTDIISSVHLQSTEINYLIVRMYVVKPSTKY